MNIHEQGNRVNRNSNVGNYVMPFGKYKGECLDDIYSKDPDYLEWIKNEWDDNSSYFNKIKENVKKYLWNS